MPFKRFTPQQLTANEVNEYLMSQTVMVFAHESERDTSVTAPIEGMFAYLKDSDRLMLYDGSSWVNVWLKTRPAFYAYLTGSVTVAGGGTVLFQNVPLNEGSPYNASTGRFTAPYSGLYWLETRCLSQHDQAAFDIRFRLNNVEQGAYAGFSMTAGANQHRQAHIQAVIRLVAGDYVSVNAITGGPINIYGAPTHGHTSFTGYWLGN